MKALRGKETINDPGEGGQPQEQRDWVVKRLGKKVLAGIDWPAQWIVSYALAHPRLGKTLGKRPVAATLAVGEFTVAGLVGKAAEPVAGTWGEAGALLAAGVAARWTRSAHLALRDERIWTAREQAQEQARAQAPQIAQEPER